MRCVWQVEINDYCRRVLAKHWPEVRRQDDVRIFPPEPADDWRCDVICGGFPCQDISHAGNQIGIDGDRSGLWSQFKRIVGLLRPRYVVVENVAALLDRGIGRVLGDLASLGFDAEWDCLPASAFGAYHDRDRVFVVAYHAGLHRQERRVLDAGREWAAQLQYRRLRGMAVATKAERENSRLEREPRLGRLVHGIPNRTHRLTGLGNTVYPEVAEWIGRRIVEAATLTPPPEPRQ
jgi:DNA (cytosine-5)-methyltransferase 1